jgi:hypothetical protein
MNDGITAQTVKQNNTHKSLFSFSFFGIARGAAANRNGL